MIASIIVLVCCLSYGTSFENVTQGYASYSDMEFGILAPQTRSYIEGRMYEDNSLVFAVYMNESGNIRQSIPNVTFGFLMIKYETEPTILTPEAFEGLKNVDRIILTNSYVSEIKPNTFHGITHLSILELQMNALEEIPAGVFDGLDLYKLDLRRNKIKKIDSTAFDDLPRLNMINLSENELTEYNPEWFKNSQDLTRVDFGRNSIRSLPSEAFRNFQNEKRHRGAEKELLLYFAMNQIEEVKPDAFYGISRIKELWLNNNLIKHIDSGFLEGITVEKLYIDQNKMECLEEEGLRALLRAEFVSLDSSSFNCTCLKKLEKWLGEDEERVYLGGLQRRCSWDDAFRRAHEEAANNNGRN